MHMYTYNYYFAVPGNITGVAVMCEEMDQIHQCTVQWDVSDYHVRICMFIVT